MSPPAGSSAVRRFSRRAGPPSGQDGPVRSDPPPPERGDHRLRLLQRIREANRRSAFNRRSRGADL
ncbi:hypothetical protein [Streptomyces sp. NPDC049881]|uniref:hypothetical protein n=1 Tax=unclassified Streptomyces TaxID=2593676 RepID=UPI00344721D5